MDESIKFFVGLDCTKIRSRWQSRRRMAPARLIGSMAHHVGKLLKLLARYGEPRQVQVVYEAGPTGYGLQCQLTTGRLSLPGKGAVADPEACGRSSHAGPP